MTHFHGIDFSRDGYSGPGCGDNYVSYFMKTYSKTYLSGHLY